MNTEIEHEGHIARVARKSVAERLNETLKYIEDYVRTHDTYLDDVRFDLLATRTHIDTDSQNYDSDTIYQTFYYDVIKTYVNEDTGAVEVENSTLVIDIRLIRSLISSKLFDDEYSCIEYEYSWQ